MEGAAPDTVSVRVAAVAGPALSVRQRRYVRGRRFGPAVWLGRSGLRQAATIVRPMVAATSGCSRTLTLWLPTVLIGFGISIFRLSSCGPPALDTAWAMSATVTAPNSRPELPARL